MEDSRSFEHKLATKINQDSKSFFAYVKSKCKSNARVGPLKDAAGQVISRPATMSDLLNDHFTSVFTREDNTHLPLPEAIFAGSEHEKLTDIVVD